MIDSPNSHSPFDDDVVARSPTAEIAKQLVAAIPPIAATRFSLATATIVILFLHCQCGHIPMFALPVSGTAFAFGAVARWKLRTGYSLFVFGLSFYIVAQNIADLLWLGHDPIFRICDTQF